MTRPILIFGAGGQVGNALWAHRTIGMASAAYFGGTGWDICDRSAVSLAVRGERPRAVINCAVYRDVDRAETDREAASAVNTDGPANLAEACAAANIPLVHLSSDYAESAETWFGATKLAGDAAVCLALPNNHIIIRTSWLYGPHGRNFLKGVLDQAKRGEEIRRPNDQVGTPTHTEDLARAILAATERVIEDPSVSGTYHFAGPDPCSWYDFAREIVEVADLDVPVTPITTAESGAIAKRPAYSALDSTKFFEVFGVRAEPRSKRIAETIAAIRA